MLHGWFEALTGLYCLQNYWLRSRDMGLARQPSPAQRHGDGREVGNTCILKLCLLFSFILDVLAHGRKQRWYQAAMRQLPGSVSVKALIFFPGS